MNPFHWGSPSTWPWLIWVWFGMIFLGRIKPAWQWLSKRRAASWPLTSGRIEAVNVLQPEPKTVFGLTLSNNSPPFQAEISYSYLVGADSYSGVKRREFADEQEAWEFLRDLKGKPLDVHYNPRKPAASSLSEPSLQGLLQSRPPAPANASVDSSRLIPQWVRPFLWFFAALSLLGLVLSLIAHIEALLRHTLPLEYWGLHVGIFVVWGPAVFVAQRRVGKRVRKDYWKVVLQGAPAWMRYMTFAFLYYAVGNFLFFIANAPAKPSSGAMSAAELRGFSGHWMAFYSAALAILYAAAVEPASPRCSRGHIFQPDEPYCPVCGQTAAPPR